MNDRKFNLIDEPWIRVTDLEGTPTEISLREALIHGNDYLMFAGEVPLQDITTLRLLMSIVYASYAQSEDELSEEEWGNMYSTTSLPSDRIENYLREHHDRFYLIHPTHPFYQVPGMISMKGDGPSERKDASYIVPDALSDKSLTAFRDRSSYDDGLSYAEAARWMLIANQYGKCGAHTGMYGDPRVAVTGGGKNKGYPKESSLGKTSVVMILGDTIAETIILNTIPMIFKDGDGPLWEDDNPLPPGPTRDKQGENTVPYGVMDLLTWNSRRIRLFESDGKIRSVLVGNGDGVDLVDGYDNEIMSSYRHVEKDGVKMTVPRVQNEEDSFWRGYDSLLAHSERFIQPRTVHWLGSAKMKGFIDRGEMFTVSVTTMVYGPKNSSFKDIIHDVNPLPVSILNNKEMEGEVIRSLAMIDEIRSRYWFYAGNCLKAIGNEPGRENEKRYMTDYHNKAETTFYDWLNDFSTGKTGTINSRLETMVYSLLQENEMRTHNPKAFIGVVEGDKVYSLPVARRILLAQVKKITRGATP